MKLSTRQIEEIITEWNKNRRPLDYLAYVYGVSRKCILNIICTRPHLVELSGRLDFREVIK